jgi:hypothetical protein
VCGLTVVGALTLCAGVPAFDFTKVDLQLLEESNAIDRQLENRGLVYHDAGLEEHLAQIAQPLLPKQPLEHVVWRFRILRDPLVNAFALPNGSIYVNSGLESPERVPSHGQQDRAGRDGAPFANSRR